MAVEGLALLAHGFTKPIADERTIDIVIVSPAFIAGVVGRIDVYALDLPCIVRQQSLESFEVVALDNQVAAARVSAPEFWHIFEQPEGYLLVVVDDRLFSNSGARFGIQITVLFSQMT
jgi:hypothetical protein